MKLSGDFTVPAPGDVVFQRINDPVFFASCIDGVSNLTEISPNEYSATLETKIAFIKFRFEIEVKIVEVVEPSKIVAEAVGVPKGVVGRLTSVATAHLEDAADETRITYEIDLGLTGKLGSLGQPVMRSKAKEMERSFIANMNASFAQEEGEDAT